MPTLILLLATPVLWRTFYTDFKAVMAAPLDVQVATGTIAFTSIIASLCLYKAIQLHAAVHAALIEITYPFFIVLFTLILFHENHFNLGTLAGGVLMIIGAGIIIYTNVLYPITP